MIFCIDACRSIYWRCRTCNPAFIIFKIFVRALGKDKKNFINLEPFDGLFTQGMVCHETYKDPTITGSHLKKLRPKTKIIS